MLATWSVFDLTREHMDGNSLVLAVRGQAYRQRFRRRDPRLQRVAFADHEIEEVIAHCDKITFT